jgi:hypothetical protein
MYTTHALQARAAVRKPLLPAQRRRRRMPEEQARMPRVRTLIEQQHAQQLNTSTSSAGGSAGEDAMMLINSSMTSPSSAAGGASGGGAGGTLPMFPVPDRLIVYSTDPFPSTQHAAHVLRFSGDHMFNKQWAKVQLPTHVPNAAFLVDLTALERQIDVHVDAYGSWGIPGSFSNFYDADDEKQQLIRKDCGDVERRTRPEAFEFRVQCCRYNHPSEPKFRKIIYKLIDCHENALRALVSVCARASD